MRRRDVLRGLALLTLTAACGRTADSVRIVVLWSGWELKQFRRVLRGFPQRGRWNLSVQSEGNDLNALIANQVARSAAPDVALIQQPSTIKANRRLFAPLGPVPDVPGNWTSLLGGHGIWFKAAHKSIVWYREDRLPGATPGSWDELVELCREMAARGRPPLAIGAADGWVLTDWFENVLLSIDPTTYRRLSHGEHLWAGDSVLEALRRIGRIWSIPGAFPGGARRALLTQYDGALVDVFGHGRAAMVAGADFFYPIIEQVRNAPAHWFRFPGLPQGRPPVVAGDAAVLLNGDSAGARALIDWLADPAAADIWAGAGGFLSVNSRVRGYPGNLGDLAADIRTPAADEPSFDLSDQLGGRLAGDDGRGTWQIFQDFFTDVAVRRVNLDDAAEHTSRVLAATAREVPS